MHLADLLSRTVRSAPDAPALYEADRWLTYAEVGSLVQQLATALGPVMPATPTAYDTHPPRVAILAENGAFAAAAFFAVATAGGVAVPLTPDLQGDRLAALLAHSEAAAVVVPQTVLPRVLAVRDAIPLLRLIVTDAPCEARHGAPKPGNVARSRSGADLAVIIYTSGSTGRPKGVMLTHEALVSNARAVVGYLGLAAVDRSLLVLPLGYVFGLSVLITHVLAGASLVLQRRFLFPSVVLDALAEHRCTGFYGVPATYTLLLRSLPPTRPELPSLRYLAEAGGALAPELQANLCDAFPRTKLYVMYGATEAGPRISYCEIAASEHARESVGRAIPGVVIRVCAEDGRELSCGESGEIWVKSTGLMLGYWRDERATRDVLRDGWYRTGDRGVLSADGELTITGRVRDFIKVRGHRVSLSEIESELCSVDGIHEVAVLGIPDDLHGEVPVAYLVAEDDAFSEVESSLARRLPRWMRPVAYRRLRSLPRTASGKVDRPALVASHRPIKTEAV